jgi:hypothetical protein
MKIIFIILYSFNRCSELQRLSAWASRKRLKHPFLLYQARLSDEYVRLNRYRLRYPLHSQLAYFVHQLRLFFFPPPRYFARGIARFYKREFLTGAEKGL